MTDRYAELSFGESSEQILLCRMLANSGYEYSGPRTMRGLSGLDHHVDAVGLRGGNLALVLSGPKDLGLRPKKNTGIVSPKFQSQQWCRDALLRMYDISAMLEREGLKVDLVLFENRLTQTLPEMLGPHSIHSWTEQHGLPKDWHFHYQSSIEQIDVPGLRYLSETARSAGACYFGLNDLTLPEISAICGDEETHAADATGKAMSRVRFDQYFNPPTDELILTALALSHQQDPAIVEDVYNAAVSLAHEPVANVIVPDTDYTDPVATARQLSNIGAIEYHAEIRLNDNGREIVQRVSKTAQEGFVIRICKAINLPQMVKALIQGLKSGE